jgi:hypothetical protein
MPDRMTALVVIDGNEYLLTHGSSYGMAMYIMNKFEMHREWKDAHIELARGVLSRAEMRDRKKVTTHVVPVGSTTRQPSLAKASAILGRALLGASDPTYKKSRKGKRDAKN